MNSRSRALALTVFSAALVVVAVVGYLNNRPDAGAVDSIEEALSVPPMATTTTPRGEATSPTDAPAWAPNESSDLARLIETWGPAPTRLTIDALGIDAPVGGYGVDENGLMDIPDNVTEIAWYEHGPRPGDDGSAVLAAHVDLRASGRGLFFELDRLSPGDGIVVTFDDDSTMMFEVVARAIYLKDELPLAAIFSRSGPPTLTLVTCGGVFSETARSYDSNVVVYAEPATSGAPDATRG